MDEHPPFIGTCVGGPLHGRRIGAHERSYKVAYRPRPISFAEGFAGNPEEIAECSHGIYRLEDEEWRWNDL